MQNDLSVGDSLKLVATLLQFQAKIHQIVNFSFVNNPKALILIGHGLVAGCKVNDANAAHAQSGITKYHSSPLVSASMSEGVVQTIQKVSRLSFKGADALPSRKYDTWFGFMSVFGALRVRWRTSKAQLIEIVHMEVVGVSLPVSNCV